MKSFFNFSKRRLIALLSVSSLESDCDGAFVAES